MGIRNAWRALWETKESATGRVVSYQKVGQPQWMSRRVETFADEGFKRNSVAFSCIDLLSSAAAAVPWVLYNPMDEEIDQHPLLKLLQKPNPIQGGAGLMQNFYAYFLIAGNAYLEGVGPDNRPPLELYALRPDRMKVVPGQSGMPQAYTYTVGNEKVTYRMNDMTGEGPILHLKKFHPLDDWYGLSPMEPAAFAIDQHNEASNWNKSLLQNSARPSGALTYSPVISPNTKDPGAGVMSDEQFDRLKRQLAEQYEGSSNSGKPMLLEGGLTWQEMAWNAKDMDWLAGKNLSANEICSVFRVPGQMLGLEGSQTFANYEQARLALYEDAVLPLLNFVSESFNNWFSKKYGEDLNLSFDEDKIPALAPRREKIFTMVASAPFLTNNEKRAAVGYEPVDGGDDLMVDASQLPAGFDPEKLGPHAKDPIPPKEAAKMAYGTDE